jgi:hypothetical protein
MTMFAASSNVVVMAWVFAATTGVERKVRIWFPKSFIIEY